MQYRIQILDCENLPKKYIPQWRVWFLPWQNYSFINLMSNKEQCIKCDTKEMCLDYFLPRKETFKKQENRHYPTFHFYYTNKASRNSILSNAINFVISTAALCFSVFSNKLTITT
jgi:hypothetical protein